MFEKKPSGLFGRTIRFDASKIKTNELTISNGYTKSF